MKFFVKYFYAISNAVGGRLILWPGAVTALVAIYGVAQKRFSLPEVGGATLILIACIPLIAWAIIGLAHRVVTLEELRRPRIGITLMGNGIYTFPLADMSKTSWVQIVVTSLGEQALEDCQLHVVSFARMDSDPKESLLEEISYCTWSDEPNGTRKLNIPSTISKRANLFSRYEHNPFSLKLQIIPEKMMLLSSTQHPGTYEIGITATATNAMPVSKTFILTWGRQFDALSLTERSSATSSAVTLSKNSKFLADSQAEKRLRTLFAWRPTWWEVPSDRFGFFVAFFTGALALFSVWQLSVMRGQLNAMERDEQPDVWVTDNVTAPEFRPTRETRGRIVWPWTFTNFGKGRPVNLEIDHFIRTEHGSFKRSAGFIGPTYGGELPTGKKSFGTTVGDEMERAEFNKLMSIDDGIGLLVEMKYFDAIGKPFESVICMGHMANGSIVQADPRICEQYTER